MGSYTFRWEHPADEVFVTGTFDNWGKSTLLEKVGSAHEKTVDLPKTDEKILYKFVADGNWSHDHTAKIETDHEGNVNNVLYPDDITPKTNSEGSSGLVGFGGAIPAISSVAPGASTRSMADTPGAFPETPANENLPTTGDGSEEQAFGVNPLPATGGISNPLQLAPGEKVPESENAVDSNVKLDKESYEKSDAGASPPSEDVLGKAAVGLGAVGAAAGGAALYAHEKLEEKTGTSVLPESTKDALAEKSEAGVAESEKTFGVNPLPATGGIGNPVQLAPGEKVPEPSSITGNTVDSNVKLDKESYEKSDAGAPVLPAQSESTQSEGAGTKELFGGLGPQTTNMIPESSMGMGADAPKEIDAGPTISSVAPTSTTNELAGQQPLESNTHSPPAIVTESQQEAHVDPEAGASPRTVQEKDEVENELMSKVPEAPPAAESGVAPSGASETKSPENGVLGMAAGGVAAAGAAVGGAALYANHKAEEKTGSSVLPQSVQDSISNMNQKVEGNKDVTSTEQATPGAAAVSDAALPQQSAVGEAVSVPSEERTTEGMVPEQVITSQKEAHVDPEASASPVAVDEKNQVENELLSKVPETKAAGEPAPDAAHAAALSSTAPLATTSGAPQLADPTAGVAALSMDDKPAAEGSKELNAPADEPALPPTSAPAETLAAPATPAAPASRDVSPMTKSPGDGPTVTTGVASSSAPAESTPAAGKPVGTPRTGKENATPQKRQSMIGRMMGTPESAKSTASGTSEQPAKKKGLFKRLAEELK